MTEEEAIAFLAKHQPMPPDHELTDEQISKYAEACRYFRDHLDPRCIRLLLQSFGDGTGMELYKHVDEVLWLYPKDLVVRDLGHALQSMHESVRGWCLLIAMEYPDASLAPAVMRCLESGSVSERRTAALTLSFFHDQVDLRRIREIRNAETDPETIGRLDDILGSGA